MKIDLNSPLSFRSCFTFPLQSALARREVLLGAVLLLIPVVGWLLNLGHRSRISSHQRLVLAGGWIQLRNGVRAKIWTGVYRGRL